MIKKIPTTLYSFNDQKEILDSDRNICFQNEDKITLILQGQERTIDREWLWLYSWFEMPTYINIDHILFIPIHFIKRKVPFKCVFIKSYYFDKTHRIVPSFPLYAISNDGECINTLTKHIYKPRINPYGYYVINIYDPVTSEYRDVLIHILVANAWVGKNQNELNPIINHIDSNKLNNDYKNLEWCNHRKNIHHAVKQGISGKELGCIIKNNKTSEVILFKNMTDAAAYLDIDVSVLKTAHFNKKNSILNNQYTITFKHLDTSDQIAPSNKLYQHIPIQVKYEDGHVEEYKTLRELNSVTGICRAMLSRLINSNGSASYKGILVRRKTDEPWPKNIKTITHYQHLKVIDKNSGQEWIFESLKDASMTLGVSRNTLKRMRKQPYQSDKYIVDFLNDI